MKFRLFVFFLLVCFVLPGSVYLDSMEIELCSYMWDMYYGTYGSENPYVWYRTFYFKDDGTLRSRHGHVIGAWSSTHGGVNVFFTWAEDGFHGSIAYVSGSVIMGGCGEMAYPAQEIKMQIIRAYRL